MKIHTILLLLFFSASLSEAETTLVSDASRGWGLLQSYDSVASVSIDPSVADPDFFETWFDQSFGGYVGEANYDGVDFETISVTPAQYGLMSEPNETSLNSPAAGQQAPVFFLREIDGGESGYRNLELFLGANDGAVVYLNGDLVGVVNTPLEPVSWSSRAYFEKQGIEARKVMLPPGLNLRSGVNLLAIAVIPYDGPGATNTLGLRVLLRGEQNMPAADFLSETNYGENSVTFYWQTPVAFAWSVRYGLSPDTLDQVVEESTPVKDHEVILTGLKGGTEYFFEITGTGGISLQPPRLGSFQTDPYDVVISDFGSEDWFYFHQLNESGAMVRPAGWEEGFPETWYQQDLGSWRLDADPYTGPIFTSGGKTPFHFGAIGDPGGTALASPVAGRRAHYFVKVIDGGETGYFLNRIYFRALDGVRLYLNGELLTIGNGDWDVGDFEEANHPPAEPALGGFIVTNLPTGSRSIFPGPNLLAVEVRPSGLTRDRMMMDIRLSGVEGIPEVNGPVENLIVNGLASQTLTLEWDTSRSGVPVVRYGISEDALDQVVSGEHVGRNHSLTLAGLDSATTYYYQIDLLNGDTSVLSEQPVLSFSTRNGIVRGPFLQKASHHSMTVHWRVEEGLAPQIFFGTAPDDLDPVIASPLDQELKIAHEHTFRNLSPETTYYYAVGLAQDPEQVPTQVHSFKTAPMPGKDTPTRIWAVGDAGYANQGIRDVYQAYRDLSDGEKTDVFLMLGDNAYFSGFDFEYQKAVFEIYPELLAETPVWSTRGNHDQRLGNNYYGVFDFPTNAESGGVPSGTESYYSFDHGNVHFICLNSQDHSSLTTGGDVMAQWLRMDLEATTAKWVVAFFHHGPYTLGSHSSDREVKHGLMRLNFLTILEEYGVDLILSGHSHNYERSMFLHGHYGDSRSFRVDEHAVDAGNGSTLGSVNADGEFILDGGEGAYTKSIWNPSKGQVSVIAGASSLVGRWQSSSLDANGLVPSQPHPVMKTSLGLLGSLVLDVTTNQLEGRYLSSTGEIRDQFVIRKALDVDLQSDVDSEAGTATRFLISVNEPVREDIIIDYEISGAAMSLGGFPASSTGTIMISKGRSSAVVELVVPISDQSVAERELTLILSNLRIARDSAPIWGKVATPQTLTLVNSPSQSWWLENFGPSLNPDWNRNDDNDGLTALMEYAYARDPMVFDLNSEPVVFEIKPTEIEMIYAVNNNRPDLRFQAVRSGDLQTHVAEGIALEAAGAPNAEGLQAYRATIPIEVGKKQFLQLQIVRP